MTFYFSASVSDAEKKRFNHDLGEFCMVMLPGDNNASNSPLIDARRGWMVGDTEYEGQAAQAFVAIFQWTGRKEEQMVKESDAKPPSPAGFYCKFFIPAGD